MLVRPERQTTWRWPAALNFALGGTGAGCFLAAVLLAGEAGPSRLQDPFASHLVPAGLVLGGFVALVFEAGRPLRSHHLLRGVGHSWMSLEFLAGVVLIAALLLDTASPHPVLLGTAVVAAAVFIVSQGLIVYRARGVRHWNMPPVPALFILTSLVAGCGLHLLLMVARASVLPVAAPVGGLLLLLLNLVAWQAFVKKPAVAGYEQVAETLQDGRLAFAVVGLGHVVPLLLLLAAALGMPAFEPLARFAAGLGGLLAAVAALVQKGVVVLATGYFRAFEFTRRPGAPAATPRDPGQGEHS